MEKLTEDSIIDFGKHKGTKIKDVDSGYLLWLYKNKKGSLALRAYIYNNLGFIKAAQQMNGNRKNYDIKHLFKRRW